MKWFVQRRDGGYIRQRIMIMDLLGRGKTGRPQRKFRDVVTDI